MNSFELLPAERELVLDIESRFRVMRKLAGAMLMETKLVSSQAVLVMPLNPPGFPLLEPIHVGSRFDEVLHFHLLKFASAENKVPRRNFVSKGFADLRDSKRDFLT